MNEATVILFGMTRNLSSFTDSFEATLIEPLRERGMAVRVVGDLNLPTQVVNPRSQENGKIDSPDPLLDVYPGLRCHSQNDEDVADDFRFYAQFPDRWDDEFRSLRNLLQQQKSLTLGTQLALERPASLYIFIRPDLAYHDSFGSALDLALAAKKETLVVPAWQFCGGLNDRFAIASGPRAAAIYGLRIEKGREFCEHSDAGLHAERLLAYVVGTSRIPYRFMSQRASRVRLDGTVRHEDFSIKPRRMIRTKLRTLMFPKSYSRSRVS